MSIMNDLRVAQEIADMDGSLEWFCQYYAFAREYNGIQESMEIALKSLGLWEKFQEQVCGEEA